VVGERRHKNPEANSTLSLEPGREHKREQLGFVSHFGKCDYDGRNKQAPHGILASSLSDAAPYFLLEKGFRP
jgi:hypothetical protein